MQVLRSLRFSLSLLGISEETGKFGVRVYIFIVIYTAIIINLIWFTVVRWAELDERINALKAMTFITVFIVYSLTFISYWDEFSDVLRMFYQVNFKYPFLMSPERIRLIGQLEAGLDRIDRLWQRMIYAYLFSTVTTPLVTIFIKVLVFRENFEDVEENLSLPYPFYYPERVNNFRLEVFLVAYSAHVMFTLFAAVYAHISNVISLNALSILEYELMLLTLSVAEMERTILPRAPSQHPHNYRRLRQFLNYFVQHHQNIYSKFNTMIRGIRWVAATISTGASLYICMSIFTIIQKEQVLLKLQEGIFLFVWAYDIYLYDAAGERITTQDENLRVALYGSAWSEKPQWFKTALLIILTRTGKPMNLKPFGLYAMNLKNFALTMNAAYSYYNLLYKFNSK